MAVKAKIATELREAWNGLDDLAPEEALEMKKVCIETARTWNLPWPHLIVQVNPSVDTSGAFSSD